VRQIGIIVRGVKKRYLSEVNSGQQVRKRGKRAFEDSSFGADHPRGLCRVILRGYTHRIKYLPLRVLWIWSLLG
jgi:hypothetical protein